jgi:TolB-like protein/AraC-like DNA-binding protein
MESLTTTDQIFLKRLTELIYANLIDENFGVHELARQAGMSHYQLRKKVHTVTGKTIIHFMRETRLRKAFEMLQNNELTVADIAYRNGFGSATYFTATFTEYYGYSPAKVKRGDVDVNCELKKVHNLSGHGKKRLPRFIIFTISAGSLLILYLFSFFKPNYAKENTASVFLSVPYKNSIAALPFKNLSDSAGNQHFADGLTEDILTHLSMVEDMKVVSEKSVEQFRGTTLSSDEIAVKLQVNYIIEGSIQKSGNTFRLWIQLIDASRNTQLFSEVYSGRYSENMFDFQTNTAKQVSDKITAAIAGQEKSGQKGKLKM